jgi:hypothetical protein
MSYPFAMCAQCKKRRAMLLGLCGICLWSK